MRDRPDPPEAVTATEGDAATIVELSGHKGRWMADKDVDALDRLCSTPGLCSSTWALRSSGRRSWT